MIYIISPYKTLTHTILASFIYNDQFPNNQYINPDNIIVPEDKDGAYIIRSHTDYDLIKKIYEENQDNTVISIIRDPISQYISGYFQDITKPPINFGTMEQVLNTSINTIIDHFNTIDFSKEEAYSLDLLFNIYKEVFHYDVFLNTDSVEFTNIGYSVHYIKNICNKTIRLIVIRSDKLSSCIDEVGKLFGINNMVIHSSNIGENKWYGSLYKIFKKNIINKKQVKLMDNYLNQEYVKCFYTGEEQEMMKNYRFYKL